MPKNKKHKASRVIRLSDEDYYTLKKIFVLYGEKGVTLKVPEICDQIFSKGINDTYRELTK